MYILWPKFRAVSSFESFDSSTGLSYVQGTQGPLQETYAVAHGAPNIPLNAVNLLFGAWAKRDERTRQFPRITLAVSLQ